MIAKKTTFWLLSTATLFLGAGCCVTDNCNVTPSPPPSPFPGVAGDPAADIAREAHARLASGATVDDVREYILNSFLGMEEVAHANIAPEDGTVYAELTSGVIDLVYVVDANSDSGADASFGEFLDIAAGGDTPQPNERFAKVLQADISISSSPDLAATANSIFELPSNRYALLASTRSTSWEKVFGEMLSEVGYEYQAESITLSTFENAHRFSVVYLGFDRGHGGFVSIDGVRRQYIATTSPVTNDKKREQELLVGELMRHRTIGKDGPSQPTYAVTRRWWQDKLQDQNAQLPERMILYIDGWGLDGDAQQSEFRDMLNAYSARPSYYAWTQPVGQEGLLVARDFFTVGTGSAMLSEASPRLRNFPVAAAHLAMPHGLADPNFDPTNPTWSVHPFDGQNLTLAPSISGVTWFPDGKVILVAPGAEGAAVTSEGRVVAGPLQEFGPGLFELRLPRSTKHDIQLEFDGRKSQPVPILSWSPNMSFNGQSDRGLQIAIEAAPVFRGFLPLRNVPNDDPDRFGSEPAHVDPSSSTLRWTVQGEYLDYDKHYTYEGSGSGQIATGQLALDQSRHTAHISYSGMIEYTVTVEDLESGDVTVIEVETLVSVDEGAPAYSNWTLESATRPGNVSDAEGTWSWGLTQSDPPYDPSTMHR